MAIEDREERLRGKEPGARRRRGRRIKRAAEAAKRVKPDRPTPQDVPSETNGPAGSSPLHDLGGRKRKERSRQTDQGPQTVLFNPSLYVYL